MLSENVSNNIANLNSKPSDDTISNTFTWSNMWKYKTDRVEKLNNSNIDLSSQQSINTKTEDLLAQPWWKTSLLGLVVNNSIQETDNSPTFTGVEEIKQQDIDKQVISSEPEKKSWPFWNRDVVDQSNNSLNTKRLTITKKEMVNILISDINDCDILFQTQSTVKSINGRILEDDTEIYNQRPNILVPKFEILPKYSKLWTLYTYMTVLCHKLNIITTKTSEQTYLYRITPQTVLNKLSKKKENSVRVLLVGIHGFFPTKIIRPLIGEPTGTSVKFITEAEKCVVKWFQKYHIPVKISKIALEKEGKVFDRVDFFFEVMSKWKDDINKADFVYFVTHSQGCPVTIMLLSRLINSNILDLKSGMVYEDNYSDMKRSSPKKIVSILAMAGINNGPFYGADQTFFVKAYSTIENDSLKELFQFQDFHSIQSEKLIQSLRICIFNGVKITFIGSINDQLVPLYSSICSFVHHPNIFRATFIDKDSRTPAFITRIVTIANSLLNLGLNDHGIIKEISPSLAGPLTGGGHSNVYNEEQVYELSLRFALETTDVTTNIPITYKPYEVDQLGSNPYHLPWCMRGLLYEAGLHLGADKIDMLFKEFEDWEPETKQLKDMKYRLNGLRSKI